MFLLFSLLFVALAVASTFLQATDHPGKRIVSPGLTVFTAVAVCYGTVVENIPLAQGLTVSIALLLLASSDFVFERSEEKPALFLVAMVLGVVSGLMLGGLFNFVALQSGVPIGLYGGCVLLGGIASVVVYRFVKVEPALKLAVSIYLVQAVILLAGGLASLVVGQVAFAVWGILVFVSDALVGLRAFPNPERPVGWMPPSRILSAILTVYYPALYALVFWAM